MFHQKHSYVLPTMSDSQATPTTEKPEDKEQEERTEEEDDEDPSDIEDDEITDFSDHESDKERSPEEIVKRKMKRWREKYPVE